MTNEASRLARNNVANSYEVVTEIVQQNSLITAANFVIYEETPSWREAAAGQQLNITLRLKGLEQARGTRVQTKLPRAGISANALSEMARDVDAGRLIGFCSRVELASGEQAQLPMMDFMCNPSPANLAVLRGLIENLGYGPGYLLQSGNSYHYYGLRLLNDAEWTAFLGKCLLMSGLVDDRYIGHQLIDGYCVLRISTGKLKASLPSVVAEFG